MRCDAAPRTLLCSNTNLQCSHREIIKMGGAKVAAKGVPKNTGYGSMLNFQHGSHFSKCSVVITVINFLIWDNKG